MKYKRILILGPAGSGKNWFGEKLSAKTDIKFYDTDDMAWKKRFTLRRSWDEKFALLKKTANMEKWIIGTGATSYIDPAVKRADVIIRLKVGFLKSTYRIAKRQIKHKRCGKEESQYNLFSLAWQNLLIRTKDEQKKYFEKIKTKYPKKAKVFSQKDKNRFLEEI